MVDDGANRAEATEHGGHAGFAEHLQANSLRVWLDTEVRAKVGGELFRQCTTRCRFEFGYSVIEELGEGLDACLQPQIHVRPESISRIGLRARIGLVYQDHVGTFGSSRTRHRPGKAAQAAELADDEPAVDEFRERMDALRFA